MLVQILIAVLVVVLFRLLDWFLNGRWRANETCKVPGRTRRFIAGNSLELLGLTPREIFVRLRNWANENKDLYRQWMYPYAVSHIYNPQDIETVLGSTTIIEKSFLYSLLRQWLGDGLLLSKGEKWVARRKVLTPAFHFSILKQFTTILEENSKKLVIDIAKKDQVLDVVPLISNVTLNSICETAMGTKLDDNSSVETKKYKSAIIEMGKLFTFRMARNLWLMFDFIYNFTKQGKAQKQVLEVIHDFPKQTIRERRSYIQKHGLVIPVDDSESDIGSGKRKMAMLDLLISAEINGTIDEDGIQEEVDTFMFEGHDTTAMGLTYALLELANNPEIQQKVLDEQKQVFGDFNGSATMTELSELKYLDYFIKETLRLYPPVPIISRHTRKSIEFSGYKIPEGPNEIHIHIFDLHRRADLYPHPLEFKPERFFPENCVDRHPYAYIPFSAGPRNCIGQKFAMLEMKSVLSHVVRKFELRPVTLRSELEFTSDLVLRTTHPVKVQFVRRK